MQRGKSRSRCRNFPPLFSFKCRHTWHTVASLLMIQTQASQEFISRRQRRRKSYLEKPWTLHVTNIPSPM
jgi:hypothetical protein